MPPTQHLADGALPAGGLWQRQVRLDFVLVAAAVLHLGDVAGRGEISDDAVGAALGDAEAGRDIAQPNTRVSGYAQHHAGMVRQEAPTRSQLFISDSGNDLLVIMHQRTVLDKAPTLRRERK